jgi:hypothetical protein
LGLQGVILTALRLSGSAALLATVAIVLRDMGLHCLFGVTSGVKDMAHRDVSMVCRGFVASSLVMLGGFLMMKRRMLQVFCNLFVVSCSLLRHENFSS